MAKVWAGDDGGKLLVSARAYMTSRVGPQIIGFSVWAGA